MTILDQLIDGLADDKVSTSSALRKFLVVGSRLQSVPLKLWATSELNGYAQTNTPKRDYPLYRGPLTTPVIIVFVGPMNRSQPHPLQSYEVPDFETFRKTFFTTHFGQSLAELEQLAHAQEELQMPWPISAVSMLRDWSRQGEVARLEDHEIHSARQVVTKPQLHGVIDAIRNTALMMALDLQSDLPEAGQAGGPTTSDEDVARAVNLHFETHIHGGTNNLGMGHQVALRVHVSQGDVQSLLAALKELGLGSHDRAALQTAVQEDGNRPGSAVKAFLAKLGSGIVQVGGEAAKPVAIEGIKKIIEQFTGIVVP